MSGPQVWVRIQGLGFGFGVFRVVGANFFCSSGLGCRVK